MMCSKSEQRVEPVTGWLCLVAVLAVVAVPAGAALEWTQAISAAPWRGRAYLGSVVYDQKMWVMCGDSYPQSAVSNDVWYSQDGANWTQATETAAWYKREAPGVVAFEDKMWDTATKATLDAENCNFGKEPCEMGKMAQMTLVPVNDADKAKHAELMQDVVLVEWAKRCGKDCAAEWNDTVGQAVGPQIPLDKL